MAGDCGSCTMCCKLMAVTELAKPKNVLCQHCDIGKGCKIYDDRPDNCRSFRCLWLQSQVMGLNALPLQMRPDKCKVVLHTTPDERAIIAKVDPKHPDAWRWRNIGLMLGELSQKVMVLVDNGREYWLLQRGQAKRVQMSAPDRDGVEHFEGYLE